MTTLASRVCARYLAAVKVTDLNLFTLASEIERQGPILRRFEPTSINGIRRCMDGGLLEQTGEKVGRGFAWKLTELGEKMLKEWYKRNPHHDPHHPKNDNRLAAGVDPKKAMQKLLASTQKAWEAFIAKLPPQAQVQSTCRIYTESLPMRGGYGPFERGEITISTTMPGTEPSSYTIKTTYDHKDGTLGVGTYSGPHALDSLMMGRGPVKEAPGRVKKVLLNLQAEVASKAKAVKPKPVKTGLTPEEVSNRLWGIKLGPVGRVIEVEYFDGIWSIDLQGRQRLDHYVGRHYRPRDGEDPEGWDSEGWSSEYAYPVSSAAQKWLDAEFGKGLFEADVGEKGHVNVQPTAAGKKLLGI